MTIVKAKAFSYELAGSTGSFLSLDAPKDSEDSLTSPVVFGRNESSLGWINFRHRFYNQILADSSMSNIKCILAGVCPKVTATKITNFKVYGRYTDGDFVVADVDSPGDMMYNEHIFLGADLIGEIIKEFFRDFKRYKASAFDHFVKELGLIETSVPGADMFSIDGRYFLKGNAIKKRVYSKSFRHLLEIKPTDMDKFLAMVPDKLAVIHTVFRPKNDTGVEHPLTKMYKKCYGLDYMSTNVTIAVAAGNFRRFYSGINKVIKGKEGDIKADPREVGLMEMVKGKDRIIRGSILSKRVDYSARCVITTNPKLKLNQVGIPKKVAAGLLNMSIETFDATVRSLYGELNDVNINQFLADEIGALMLNRAPTLHKLSILGFEPVICEGFATELHPLVCSGFNADHDGDTMAQHMPVSQKAKEEVKSLMLPTKTKYHPASGKPLYDLRHEAAYGANILTKEYNGKGKDYPASEKGNALKKVMNHTIKVYDTIGGEHAGRLALSQAMGLKNFPIYELRKKTKKDEDGNIIAEGLSDLMKRIDQHSDNDDKYQDVVKGLLILCNKVATLYSPTANILDNVDATAFENAAKEAERRVSIENPGEDLDAYRQRYMYGLISKKSFNDFREKLASLTREIALENIDLLDNVMAPGGRQDLVPGIDTTNPTMERCNGFLQLARAGARGDENNILQLYSFKGQLQKAENESFSSFIDNSLLDQLSPTENFMGAYGSRNGMIDKTVKTADTGYADRLMFMGAGETSIRSADCKTRDRTEIRFKDINQFVVSSDEVPEAVADMITGLYASNGKLLTPDVAKGICMQEWDKNGLEGSVKVRTVFSCGDPCCSKCYGIDWSTRLPAAVGLPVGYIAGESIGEPGTQLTMRKFHKGGVASKIQRSSDFDRVKLYINQSTRIKDEIAYTPVVPYDCTIRKLNTRKIETVGKKTYHKALYLCEPVDKANEPLIIKLLEDIEVITIDHEGNPILYKEGDFLLSNGQDFYIPEILNTRGLKQAQLFLAYSMYFAFKESTNVAFTHFLILAESMTKYVVLESSVEGIRFMDHISCRDYKKNKRKIVAYPEIVSVKQIALLDNQVLSKMSLERVTQAISDAVLSNYEDDLSRNMSRVMVGEVPNIGTEINPNFANERLHI